MARYVYREDGEKVKPVLVSTKIPARGTPACATMPFHENILHACKLAEAQGIPWANDVSINTVKRVHEMAAK